MMSGFITFWSKDYIKQLNKHKDNGKLCVVYGSQHTKMPSISAVKIGDIIYPVSIKDKTLCVMARLPVDKIEPAYEYLIRETGFHYSALIPEGILIQSQGIYGQFNVFHGGSGYTDKIKLPQNIHTVLHEEDFVIKPHKFHQEPITCCADVAASGSQGSLIKERIIPIDDVKTFLFGSTKSTQKPLRLDKSGNLTSVSLGGFTRKMSESTFQYFEDLFK